MGHAMTALRERFEAFIETYDGFENIDTLLKGNDQSAGKNRADYLLQGRKIIVEQKTLEVDPSYRPQNFVNKLMERGRIIVFGTVSTRQLSEPIRRELTLDLTKNLDALVAKADKQTRDTRQIFSIPDAMGVLVILNEQATTLTPDIIRYGLEMVFQKRVAVGSLRYPHNDAVILIPEAHKVDTPNGYRIPLFSFISPHGRANEEFAQFWNVFIGAWAKFNDVPLIRLGV
jgi:hypothetical protein